MDGLVENPGLGNSSGELLVSCWLAPDMTGSSIRGVSSVGAFKEDATFLVHDDEVEAASVGVVVVVSAKTAVGSHQENVQAANK